MKAIEHGALEEGLIARLEYVRYSRPMTCCGFAPRQHLKGRPVRHSNRLQWQALSHHFDLKL
jgi:hypothetical protein